MGRKKNRKRNRSNFNRSPSNAAPNESKAKTWKQIKKYLPCHSGTVKAFEDPTSGVSIYGGGYLRELEIYFGHMIIDVGADVEVECINIKNATYPELEAFNNPIVQIDWEDFGTVALPRDFWETVVELIRKEKRNVTVCCQGGHGRTGTVLAILAHFMGVGGQDPVQFVRDNYCYRAVESWNQLRYVAFITGTPANEDIPHSAFVWEWANVEKDDPANFPLDPDNNPLTEGETAVSHHITGNSIHTSGKSELTKLNEYFESKENRTDASTGRQTQTLLPNPHKKICASEDIEKDDNPNGFEKVTTASGATVYVKPAPDKLEPKVTTYANGKFVKTHNNNGVLVIEAGHEIEELLTPKAEKELEELDGNRKSDNPLENLRDVDKQEIRNHYHKKPYSA